MIEKLEQQRRLTSNQWKLIITGNLADLLDFFDFFLIGYVLAFITKEWPLTYWQGAVILLSSGIGAVPGAFFWGWVADKIGRRKVFILTALNVALATGIMALTPGPNGWISGWLFLAVFRLLVGIGNAGIYAVDMPLVQEFMPAKKRGWVGALITTLLPAGSMLGGVAGWLLPIIGWRGLFLLGLAPIVLVLMVRYWVPESPRWLTQMGRHEEARKSLAWALMVDPKEIDLPTTGPEVEKGSWWLNCSNIRERHRRLPGRPDPDRRRGLGLWGATLFVLVLKISPADAAFLMIFVNLAAIAGRFSVTALIEPLGRRGTGTLYCAAAAVLMVLAGYLHNVVLGSVSLFFVLVMAQNFFGSAAYSVAGPYMTEIWPTRLRASGMGLAYGVGNSGKIVGPLGLALILGANDLIEPAANLDSLGLAFVYFASWYVLGIIAYWFIGFETKGRSFEEIDESFATQAASGTPSGVRASAT